MAMEIEKIGALQKRVEVTQRSELEGIIDVLSTDFQEMLKDTRMFLMTGDKVSRDFSKSITALHKLKSFGDQYGVEFPEINTNEEAAIYLLKFGSQVIKGE